MRGGNPEEHGAGDHDDGGGLHQAAAWGDTAYLQHLVDAGADIDEENDDGHTALSLASYYGHEDAVRLLLNAGANPVSGASAAMEQGHAEILELLMEAAILMGTPQMVGMLMERGGCLRRPGTPGAHDDGHLHKGGLGDGSNPGRRRC